MITGKEWRPCVEMLRRVVSNSDNAILPEHRERALELLRNYDDNNYLGKNPNEEKEKKAKKFKVHPLVNLACYNVKHGTTGLDNLHKVVDYADSTGDHE